MKNTKRYVSKNTKKYQKMCQARTRNSPTSKASDQSRKKLGFLTQSSMDFEKKKKSIVIFLELPLFFKMRIASVASTLGPQSFNI